MSRELRCRTCGDNYELHPEDKARGITVRKVYVLGKKPERHGVTVNGHFEEVPLICDQCSARLEGRICVAITVTLHAQEIGSWENDYGKVLTEDAVRLTDALSGGAS